MTTSTAAPTPRTIHELRKYDGPLYIANNTPFLVTCHEQVGDKRVDFELDPQGQPDSVRMIPALALEVRGIQKLWLRGDITISTDETMEDQITLLINQGIKAPQERLDAIMARGGEDTVTVEGSANNRALVYKACLECGHTDPTSGVITRGQVVQTVTEQKDGIAPLCPVHAGMATQFVGRLAPDGQGGQVWEYSKVALTGPVRGEPKTP